MNQVEKFVLVVTEILRLFFNILTTNDKYSLSRNECLTQPIQMQLLKNRKIFSEFFSAFLKSTQKLEYFEKEDDPPRFFVSEIIDCKKRSFLNAQKALCQKTYGQSTC